MSGDYCPFLTYVGISQMCDSGHSCSSDGYLFEYDVDPTKVLCLESECMLWNSEKETCNLSVNEVQTDTDLSNVENSLSVINTVFELINDELLVHLGVSEQTRFRLEKIKKETKKTADASEDTSGSMSDANGGLRDIIQIFISVVGEGPAMAGGGTIVQLLAEILAICETMQGVVGTDVPAASDLSTLLSLWLQESRDVIGRPSEKKQNLKEPHPENPYASLLRLLQHINGHHFDRTNQRIGWASVLVNEYHCNEDLDGNGKVYGRDFYIVGPGLERFPLMQPATVAPDGGDGFSIDFDGYEPETESTVYYVDGQKVDLQTYLANKKEPVYDPDTKEQVFVEKIVGNKQNTDKPKALWSIPNRGSGMSWRAYLAEVEDQEK